MEVQRFVISNARVKRKTSGTGNARINNLCKILFFVFCAPLVYGSRFLEWCCILICELLRCLMVNTNENITKLEKKRFDNFIKLEKKRFYHITKLVEELYKEGKMEVEELYKEGEMEEKKRFCHIIKLVADLYKESKMKNFHFFISMIFQRNMTQELYEEDKMEELYEEDKMEELYEEGKMEELYEEGKMEVMNIYEDIIKLVMRIYEDIIKLMQVVVKEFISVMNIYEDVIKLVMNIYEDIMKLMQVVVKDFISYYKSVEGLGLKTGEISRESLLMMFLILMMFVSQLLLMLFSLRYKKRYILLWTDHAILLALLTCGDVEPNPGPPETKSAKARSKTLREFRRSSQTILLEMMYKACNQNSPINLYREAPPGWDKYKPEVKFENISNLRSGEDKVFSKMIYLLKKSPAPLQSEWELLLKHYNNLNAKFEQEESKKALDRWMLEKKLNPLLQRYSEEVDVPSVEIQHFCLAVMLKAANMEQPDDFDSNEFDDKDQKTRPNRYAGFMQTNEETANAEMLPLELFNNKERPQSDTDISVDISSFSQQCCENQRVEVPHPVQSKKRGRPEESTSAAGTKILKKDEKGLVQSQEVLMENNPLITENHDGDTRKTTDDQYTQTCFGNVDPSMLPCNKRFLKSDQACAQQVSSSKDNFGEIEDQETLRSNNLPGEENHADDTCNKLLHADDTCGELLPNSDTSLCFNNIDDELNELDGDQAEMSPVSVVDSGIYAELAFQLYEPLILMMYLEKYSKDLGNGRPSYRIVELCKDILNKEHRRNACNTDTN